MVLLKEDIENQQSTFQILRADTGKLSDDLESRHQEVFSDRFMRKYTRYGSFSDFMEESPANEVTKTAFGSREFDQFVSKNTVFDDWNEMKKMAAEDWVVSEIRL